MGKTVVSIEIGLQETKVCEITYCKKNPKVFKCFAFDNPKDSIEDGYIRDKNVYAAELKEQMTKYELKNKSVIFTVSSTKIANREMMIPFVKEDKINAVVKAAAADYFSFDITDYSLSYFVLDKINNKDKKMLKLLVLAAPNQLIKNYYSLSELMGFEIQAIDYFGNSLYQIMRKQIDPGRNLVIQINEQTSVISIMEREHLLLQRTVPYGSKDITDTLLENKIFGISTEKEAAELLRKEELINRQLDISALEETKANLGDDADSMEHDRLFQEMQGKDQITESISYLVNNVVRMADYYYAKYSDKRLGKAYLSGPGARFFGMRHLFQSELELEVKRIEDVFAVTFVNQPIPSAGEKIKYLPCIGASIAPVCFELSEYKVKEERKSSIKGIAAILTASVVAASLMSVYSVISCHKEIKKQEELNGQLLKLNFVEEVYQSYEQQQTLNTELVTVYQMTETRMDHLNELFSELEKKMPKAAVIKSFTAAKDGFSINYAVDGKQMAAYVINSLRNMKDVGSAAVQGITQEDAKTGTGTVNFSVNCTYSKEDAKEIRHKMEGQ